jgi:tRNA(Ile)-lysidine synthase
MTFLDRVYQTITKYQLIKSGDAIIIGVSGGADSIALLESLLFWQSTLGLKLIAGHIHHGLRKEADADQNFVKKWCTDRNIPCEIVRVRVSKESPGSIEERAREKRFDALISIAKKYNADSIALAHHQDDLAETVLMRIIRGTGLQGLQAILPSRTINGMRFIRPFIDITRSDIEKFLVKRSITYRIDQTNTDITFFRNKIRHHLLPLLAKQYNPKISSALSNLAKNVGLDYDFLFIAGQTAFQDLANWETAQKLFFHITDLNQLHPAVLRSVMRLAIHAFKGNTNAITTAHIQKVEAFIQTPTKTKSELHLPQGIKLMRQKNRLYLYQIK